MAQALRDRSFKEAAKIYSDFSVTPHGQWLAAQRKSRPSEKKTIIGDFLPDIKKASSARNNGRRRTSPRSGWVPHDLSEADISIKGVWHSKQALMMLKDIQRELEKENGLPITLKQLVQHKISVRIEREVEKHLRLPEFFNVRKIMPPRWQPRSYYLNTPRSLSARLKFIRRKVRKAVKSGGKFFIRVDKGLGIKPRDLGPFSDPNQIRLGANLLCDSEIHFRLDGLKTWTTVGLPVFKPRLRRSPNSNNEYALICERHGSASAEAALYAWQEWGIKPRGRGRANAIASYGNNHPMVKFDSTRKSHKGVEVQFHQFLSRVTREPTADDRPSGDPGDSAEF